MRSTFADYIADAPLPTVGAPADTTPTRTWLTSWQAARIAEITPEGMRDWCVSVPNLGRFVGGRWRVDPAVLARVLAGEIHPIVTSLSARAIRRDITAARTAAKAA